jgi:hypothetical protein
MLLPEGHIYSRIEPTINVITLEGYIVFMKACLELYLIE